MPSLLAATRRLVETATGAGDDRALRAAVRAVMTAFDPDDAVEARAALRLLDGAAAKASGRAAQVLHLALGALVEEGAPPEAAWRAVRRGLREDLEAATRFAAACVKRSGEEHVDDAVASAGPAVAQKKPAEAAAWQVAPARSLAAVACLTRSRKLRKAERRSGDLLAAAFPLEDAVDEVGLLGQVLRVMDDEVLLVIHPAQRRAFRVALRDVSTNDELAVLLADALIVDPKAGAKAKGGLSGARPSARAVAAAKNEAQAKKPPVAAIAFDAFPWTALGKDGTLDGADPDASLWRAGGPADIPAVGGERVVLLADRDAPLAVTVEPTFPALRPEVIVKARLSAAQIDASLAAIRKAPRPKRRA